MPDRPTNDLPTADGSDHNWSGGNRRASGGGAGGGSGGGGGGPRLEQPGDEIGPYRLVSEIGEGGFGSVWIAERRHPFVQRVALKLIKPGMDSKAVIARFEQERQALAVMDHPNIARVLDGGLTPAGRPYFAMELVKGEPITDFCDRTRLTLRQRIELFIPVCEAVQHAHMKGIIHRDLKPSNILVMVRDEQPMAKVIDFGVAKAISHSLTEKTIYTETGQLIGTPEYMSPEQAEMGRLDVDTRTDVYALGVVLYELLAGALPFESKALRSKGFAEIQRIIREEDPPRPSTRLTSLGAGASEIAKRRQVNLGDLKGQLTRELEWIPLKAIRKDRTQRYRTPSDLADDLRNYLAGRPLVAAPESTVYRLQKYVRRNRALLAGAGAVVGALLVGLCLAVWQWSVALALKDSAQQSAADALAAEGKARAMSDELRQERDRLSKALDDLKAEQEQRRNAEKVASARSAQRLETYGKVIARAASLVESGDEVEAHRQLSFCDADLRDWEWHYLFAASDESVFALEIPKDFDQSSVSLTPDGASLVIEGSDRIWVWDSKTFEPRSSVAVSSLFKRLEREKGGEFTNATLKEGWFSPDATRALIMFAKSDGQRRFAVVDINSGGLVSMLDTPATDNGTVERLPVEEAVLSQDGRRIALTRVARSSSATGFGSGKQASIDMFDADKGSLISSFRTTVDTTTAKAQFDPTGSLLATRVPMGGYSYGTASVDVATGEQLHVSSGAVGIYGSGALIFGNAVVSSSSSGIGIIDARTGETLRTIPRDAAGAQYISMVHVCDDQSKAAMLVGADADTWRLLVADIDGASRRASAGESRRQLMRVLTSGSPSFDMDASGRMLVFDSGRDPRATHPRMLRAWDLSHPGAQGVFRGDPRPVRSIAFGAGDRELLVKHADGSESSVSMPARAAASGAVKLDAPRGAVKIVELAGVTDSASGGSPDAPPGSKEYAIVGEADGQELVRVAPEGGRPTTAVLLPGGSRIAVGLDSGGVMIVSLATGSELIRVGGSSGARAVPKGAVKALAVSSDGTRLAAALDTSAFVVWDIRSNRDRDLETSLRRELAAEKLPSRALAKIGSDSSLSGAQKTRARAAAAQLESLGVGVEPFVRAVLAKKDATPEEFEVALRLHDAQEHPDGPSANETCWISAQLSYSLGRYPDALRWMGGEEEAVKWVQGESYETFAATAALTLHGLGKPTAAARAARALVRDPFTGSQGAPEKRSEMSEMLDAKARETIFAKADEARAWQRVKERVDRRESVEQMIDGFVKNESLTAGERALSIALASWGTEQAKRLNGAAWNAVLRPGRPASFAKALDQSERAVALTPDDYNSVNTLAVARYRSEKYAEALQALERAKALATKGGGEEGASDAIFLAMTQFRLGQVDAAKAQLARAKERKSLSDQDKLFLKEADQLISAKEPKSKESREKDAAKP